MAGIITASQISGSLDAKNIVLGVLTRAKELSNLSELCTTVQVPKLVATIPVELPGSVDQDLDEWEDSPVKGSTFASVAFDLEGHKDRFKVAVSDEAQFKSEAGDPLAIQNASSAMLMANLIDKKIVTALQTNPQTGSTAGAWSTVTNNPLKDLAAACGKIRPYKADFVIMTSDVWAAFVGNDYTAKFVTGAPEKLNGILTVIPGLNLKVYVCDQMTAKTCIVGCSGVPSAVIGNGPVKIREKDSEKGGRIIQADYWRQVIAPIIKNDATKNVGAVQITGVIA